MHRDDSWAKRKWQQKWQLRSSFNLIQFWIFFNGRCLAELEEELPEVLYRCAEQVSHWISSKSRRLSGRTVFDIIGIIGHNHPQQVQRNLWFKSRLILDSLIFIIFFCLFFVLNSRLLHSKAAIFSIMFACLRQSTDRCALEPCRVRLRSHRAEGEKSSTLHVLHVLHMMKWM